MSHFLKRLELNGFKSFAGKTVLEFPAGIVAIVGPNGSGKSNIVDAVRWLLGEREAKNLRGGKVEDLIFSGTQKRARVGMANASLHFENKNKFFPVDFEEVAIMRQITRGGDSKYFLNKSEVLLRDLVGFFAKARLGSRGLIIIGQGDSDLFIRSTPMERREMIEEILGLREYQLKRGDAERRLKNSRINLDKTKALVEEILPHLRSLKRQTNRWERRGALQEELRGLEDQFFGFQLKQLSEKGKVIAERITADKKQLDLLMEARHVAEARQAEIEASQPEEKKGLTVIKTEIQSLLSRKGELQKDLGRLEARIEFAPAAAGAAVDGPSHGRLTALINAVKDELERALQEDALELHATVENILEEIRDVLQERKEEQPDNTNDTLRPQLEKISKDLAGLEKEILTLREKEKSFEQSQEGFYKNFKATVAEVQAAKDRVGEWEDRNREQVLEKERIDLHREEILRQIEQAGRKVEEFSHVTVASETHETALHETESRIFRLRGDLASIGEIDEALMKEARDTEARYTFLAKESEDLEKAVADLTHLMQELNEKIKTEFDKSLSKINDEFNKFFALMFGGGMAKLKVEKPRVFKKEEEEDGDLPAEGMETIEEEKEEDVIQKDGGVEIDIKLPRKKVTSLDMLSGGERSLVGIAALFAMVSVSPPPFLVLDEIDAPLDERNARRFGEMLKDFSRHTQFVVVTHNRATMEAADILYGVTLDEDGSSKVISLKLEPTA